MQVQDFPHKAHEKYKNPKHVRYLFCLVFKED